MREPALAPYDQRVVTDGFQPALIGLPSGTPNFLLTDPSRAIVGLEGDVTALERATVIIPDLA